MKTPHLLAIAIAAVLLTGCLLPSLNPLFEEKEFIQYNEIVGTWSQDGKGEDSWTFERDGNHYKLTHLDEKKRKGVFVAGAGRIGTNTFLNMLPHDDSADSLNDLQKVHFLPMHVFMKVHKEGTSIKLTALDVEWLQKFLKANPKAIQHVIRDDYPVMTASTADLQKFVAAHAGDTNAFKNVIDLQPLQR